MTENTITCHTVISYACVFPFCPFCCDDCRESIWQNGLQYNSSRKAKRDLIRNLHEVEFKFVYVVARQLRQ